MRDKKRIDRILSLLEILWKRSPDLRFHQLLIAKGLASVDESLWWVEDNDIEERLNLLLKEENEKN